MGQLWDIIEELSISLTAQPMVYSNAPPIRLWFRLVGILLLNYGCVWIGGGKYHEDGTNMDQPGMWSMHADRRNPPRSRIQSLRSARAVLAEGRLQL